MRIGASRLRILDMKWANPSYYRVREESTPDLDLMLLNEDGLLQILHLPSVSIPYRNNSNTGSNSAGISRNTSLLDMSQAFFNKRTLRTGSGSYTYYQQSGSNVSSNNNLASIDELCVSPETRGFLTQSQSAHAQAMSLAQKPHPHVQIQSPGLLSHRYSLRNMKLSIGGGSGGVIKLTSFSPIG